MTADHPSPVAVSPEAAAKMLGISRGTFYTHIYPHVRSGTIQSLKIGGLRRIVVASLLAWVERESSYNGGSQPSA